MADKKEVVILTFFDADPTALEGLKNTIGAILEQTYPFIEFVFTTKKMDTIPIDEFKAAIKEIMQEVKKS